MDTRTEIATRLCAAMIACPGMVASVAVRSSVEMTDALLEELAVSKPQPTPQQEPKVAFNLP